MTVNDYPHARCRALGHQWKHEAKPARAQNGVMLFTSKCESCGTIRSKHIFPSTGELYYTQYIYPATYPTHGPERRKPIEWRKVLVKELK